MVGEFFLKSIVFAHLCQGRDVVLQMFFLFAYGGQGVANFADDIGKYHHSYITIRLPKI